MAIKLKICIFDKTNPNILLSHFNIAYINEADGKTQTGQEDAKDLEEFCHSTVTDSINPKNYAA